MMDGGRGHDGVMTSRVRAYYHLYTQSDRWVSIFDQHLDAMALSGVDWELVVGVVGPENTLPVVAEMCPEAVIEWWPTGYEQRTLTLIYADVTAGYDGPVLYAHSKGSAHTDRHTVPWRECMTQHLVRDAKQCLDLLDNGADTVGCHWLTPETHTKVDAAGSGPIYGGNFWWATSEHLRRLGPPATNTRFDAESWVGSVRPERAVSLVNGWPGYDCTQHLG